MITLLQLKTFLKIASAETSQDTLLTDFKARALEELNTLCNRKLNYAERIDEITGKGKDTIFLKNFPLHSVTSVEQYNILGDYTFATIFTGSDTIANSSIITADIGRLMLTKGYAFASGQLIRVTYTAGYVSADDWVTSTAYLINDYVRYNNRLYKCLIAHTSGVFATDLTALKWEVATETLAPADLQNAQIYLAAKMYYESPAGKNYFMKQTDTKTKPDVTETLTLKEIDIQKTVDAYRNINV